MHPNPLRARPPVPGQRGLCAAVTCVAVACATLTAAASGAVAHRNVRALLVLGPNGRTHFRADRFLPADLGPSPSSHAIGPIVANSRLQGAVSAAAHRPTVATALRALGRSGAITASAYRQDSAAYLAARRSLRRLTGTRRLELFDVLANVQAIAAAGKFTASRLPALFLTLERNRRWWTTGPLLSSGQRVGFPGSRLVWEYYPGQGIEIQWLGTFGEANGYYLSGHNDTDLRKLLDEVIPLAAQRAGGIAWEYLFQFDGGLPPWTSGLSQGTALQALARGFSRFHEAPYLAAARQALGIFGAPPPAGVRVRTPAGAHYLEYTYAPRERILNGFIQAVIGLYDYSKLTGDQLGARLFEAGDAEARLEVPHYDTGAWSLYDQSTESDLSYHELLTEFLKHLCTRTMQGEPLPATPAPAPPGGGGASPALPGGAARASLPAPQIPGDEIYCTTAQHFTDYLQAAPAIAVLTHNLPGGTRAGVRLSLSKISTVSLTVRHGSLVVWRNRATVEHGTPRLLWITPAKGGTYSVTASAVDLAGNEASTTAAITVQAAAQARRTPRRH